MDCHHDLKKMIQTLLCILTWKQKCTRTRRQEHINAANVVSKVLLSFTGEHVMTTTDGKQPALMNEARWHTSTCSCILTWFYFGRLLQPLTNENHMMDQIQLLKKKKKRQRISHWKKKHQVKAFGGFDPSRPLKKSWGYRMISIICYNFWWSISLK